MKKSQVKLEVKNLPIMSQSGQNKLGQQRYEPCEPMSAWESQNPEKKPGWARLTQNEPDEHEWKSEPKRDQSEPERPRVSQKEFDSGLKVPCSQLIMHDNEMEIGSLTVKGRLAYKPLQWEEDWLKKHNERGIGWQTAKRRQILAHRAIIAGSRRPCSNSFLDYQNMFCTIVSVYIRWLSWP